jgi:hypothetical protein
LPAGRSGALATGVRLPAGRSSALATGVRLPAGRSSALATGVRYVVRRSRSHRTDMRLQSGGSGAPAAGVRYVARRSRSHRTGTRSHSKDSRSRRGGMRLLAKGSRSLGVTPGVCPKERRGPANTRACTADAFGRTADACKSTGIPSASRDEPSRPIAIGLRGPLRDQGFTGNVEEGIETGSRSTAGGVRGHGEGSALPVGGLR